MTTALPPSADLDCYRGSDWETTITTTVTAANLALATFTVKKKPDSDVILELDSTTDAANFDVSVDNAVKVVLPGADTDALPAGFWFYDLLVKHETTKLTTFQAGRFNLTAAISATSPPE